MHRNLVKEQVMKTQSNKHRKAKQVQLQNFQHKEGKLNIIEMHKNSLPYFIITSIMHKLNNITITRTIVAMITYPNKKHMDTSSHNTTL